MGRILLIDDDQSFTDFLVEHIHKAYPLLQVDVCCSQVAARRALTDGGYDLTLIDVGASTRDGLDLLSYALQAGIDKNRIVIISALDADILHQLCPMGTCLAVLNKFEVRQKAVLEMVLSSISRKSAARSGGHG